MRILKTQIPIDDRWHEHTAPGLRLVHVAHQKLDHVTVWFEQILDDEEPSFFTELRVFGTGHEIPDEAIYVGTAHDTRGFVWHLFYRTLPIGV